MSVGQIHVNTLEMTNILHIKNALDVNTCKEIVEQVLKYKDGHPSTEDSNDHCWRGDPHLYGGLDNAINEKIQDAISQARSIYDQTLIASSKLSVAPSISAKYDAEHPKIGAWFNVNDLGGANMIHLHAGSYLSGCLYFQSTGTGSIEFYSQAYLYKNMHPLWPYFGSSKYYPEDGDLMLFPSNLAHYVEPNPIIRQRINMAFNINYDLK
jgi:uncharacterized protein (TIGR02466 family)